MPISSSGSTSSGRSSNRVDGLLIGALTLLALLLRAVRLDLQPLWWDEGYSVWFAHQPLAEMIRLTALDIHPPLYYALLGGWAQLFGLEPVALRWLSVVVGVAAVPLIYLVGLWLAGRRVGLAAALLMAISPLHIYYSQEVRMYALVALWSLLALGMAGRWLGLGPRTHPAEERVSRGWLVGYVVALALGLYTQYYVAFLVAGLAVAGLVVLWRRRAGVERALVWLAAQGIVALLFLPWLLYAAPKLVPYVSQKIVQDSDQPLGLLLYLARHLAAYAAGHLEGPLARAWPLGLIGVVLLAIGLLRLLRRRPLEPDRALLLAFLGIVLAVLLGLGWLVNLGYPFFPDRGERLLLLGLPVFLLLLAATWVAPDPVLAKGQRVVVLPEGQVRLAQVSLASLALLAALSLAAFYMVPRYPDEDYRPLIDQVMQWGQPEDTVFAIFPWQMGYFWSYGRPDGPQPELAPNNRWEPAVASALDAALARGRVWFPEHLSLGGRMETAAEQYLAEANHQLANRWYSPSTRLTGWVAAKPAPGDATTATATFDGGVQVEASYTPQPLLADNSALPVTLDMAGLAGPLLASLRLVGADGRIWAQQDIQVERDGVLRAGLLAPAGTPPGSYTLQISLATPSDGRPLGIVAPDQAGRGNALSLGAVAIQAPSPPPAASALPIEHAREAVLDDTARLLGYSATPGPLLPGEDLVVNLFWQALPGVAGPRFAFVQLLDRQGQVAAGWEGPPVAWHPTSDWQPAELVRSQHTLRLPATLAAGRYRLVAGLFDPASGERIPVSSRHGPWDLLSRRGELAVLGQVAAGSREHSTAPVQPQVTTDASLAGLGRLLGYDLGGSTVAPGDVLDLTLYWQPTETTGERLTVFVHLLDAQGKIITQSDGEPAGGEHPTSSWLPDELIADQHRLRVPADAPAGPATLVVGLYDPTTGRRAAWIDGGGRGAGDHLPLPTSVNVASPR